VCVDSGDSMSKVAAADDDEYRSAANDNAAEDGDDELMDQQTDNEDVDAQQHQHSHADDFDEFYNSRSQPRADAKPSRGHAALDAAQSSHYRSIECLINNEYTVACRQDDNGEVYLPFKFIGKYFEVCSSSAVCLMCCI